MQDDTLFHKMRYLKMKKLDKLYEVDKKDAALFSLQR